MSIPVSRKSLALRVASAAPRVLQMAAIWARRSRGAGSIPGTWPCGILTATSSCASAARTSSSPAARTSPASKSSRRSPPTRPCSNARSSGSRTRTGASARRRSLPSTRAPRPPRRRSSRSAGSASPTTSAGLDRVRSAAEDINGQDPEVRAAPARVGGPGHAGRRCVTFLNRRALTQADHHRRTERLGI